MSVSASSDNSHPSAPSFPATIATLLAILLLLVGVAPQSSSAQADSQLLDPGIRNLLHEALSGERAKEYVIEISRYHRIQGSRGYRYSA